MIAGTSFGVDIDVVIEIPRGSRNKYEWDPERQVMRLDRRIAGAVTYPRDYGFVPDTLAADGDPVDALVLLEEATFPGIWITARAVGVCWTDAEKYQEPKIICVPVHDPSYASIKDISQLPQYVLDEIKQFYDVYKEFEEGNVSRVLGFDGATAAEDVLREARRRASSDEESPPPRQ